MTTIVAYSAALAKKIVMKIVVSDGIWCQVTPLIDGSGRLQALLTRRRKKIRPLSLPHVSSGESASNCDPHRHFDLPPAVEPYDLGLSNDMPFHRLLEIGLLCAGAEGDGRIERIELEEIAVRS
jgi:hypothetical protein